MERGGVLGTKIWKEELKKLVLVLAGVIAICALVQAWTTGYSTGIWFSFDRFNGVETGNYSTSPPAAAISPQSRYGVVDHENHSINNSSLRGTFALAPAGSINYSSSPAAISPQSRYGVVDHEHHSKNNLSLSGTFALAPAGSFQIEMKNQSVISIASANNSLDSHHLKRNESVISGDNSTTVTTKEEWVIKIEQQLLSAKYEIENAAPALDNPELYGPVYHNVSRFKRSYEMMEKVLKVYVYPDGEKPYFHEGPMVFIYASEGWFMKQMEENKQFVTKDFKKAHVYYMPYSVYEMRRGIPAPEQHNMPQISLYIRDYVNTIASKYPFWNRTHGRDHFFVACHDWGPYTTKEHPELRSNAIKVLCNADLSEGYFVSGKDGALPETNLYGLQQPPRGLGGLPIRKRSILAFFAGGSHGRVRPVLFKYWKDKDPSMKIYENLPPEIAKEKSYINHMKDSKYCLCPMGYEVSSPRLVEAIYYDCVPVIIADHFFLPFSEVLNWESFSITVAEKDIPNLKTILLGISGRRYMSMQLRLSKVRKHFLWHRNSPQRYDIFHMILHSVWRSRLNEIDC
eukprot:PITA_26730